jgi:uncharacterized membrane protein
MMGDMRVMEKSGAVEVTPGISAGVTVERVPFDAPWNWLALGWRDLWAAPRVSLLYGGLFALAALGLTYGLMLAGYESLILALGGGFLLVGPIAAVGLYETSRRLETGESISLREVITTGLRAPGQLGFFGAILAFTYILWLQIAFLLFMLFMGGKPLPPMSEFLPTLLFTARGLGLLVSGTLAGAVLALLIFAVSAVSPPLLMTRRMDAISAIAASFAALLLNPKPMLLWAALIAGFMALGIATMYVGLVFAFPLIGHATWHAYRDLIPQPSKDYL